MPANATRQTNADLMLGRRLRRRPNIKSALVQLVVFAGYALDGVSPGAKCPASMT